MSLLLKQEYWILYLFFLFFFSFPITFDIPQGEVTITGGFRCQGEVEAMPRLWLISIHHADGMN